MATLKRKMEKVKIETQKQSYRIFTVFTETESCLKVFEGRVYERSIYSQMKSPIKWHGREKRKL